MAIVVQGGTSGIAADTNASKQLKTESHVVDTFGNPILVTEDLHLMTSLDSMLFFEQVDGNVVNNLKWNPTFVTMTIAQASGFLTLNSAAITTVSTSCNVTSNRQFPLYGTKPLRLQVNAKVTVGPQANATMELGLGFVATNAAPTDGVFFRWASDGTFRAVTNRGGVETQSAALTAPSTNDSTLFEVIIVEDATLFYVDDVLVSTIATPIVAAYPIDVGHQPIFARVYNGGSTPTTAPVMSIGQVLVIQESLNQNKLWKETLVALGQGSYQSPITAFGQTANFANSAAPASATLSNTAAGYTTLGGKFQFVAVAGAETDFALFGYQVPTGYQLYVTGIAITLMNTVVAVATTPTTFEWGIAVNASAVSLATADAAGPPMTWAPRRLHIGQQSFATGAVVGATATDIVRTFDPPLTVDSGRFFHVILRMPVGTATATEIFRGGVQVSGYFE